MRMDIMAGHNKGDLERAARMAGFCTACDSEWAAEANDEIPEEYSPALDAVMTMSQHSLETMIEKRNKAGFSC